MPDTFCIGCINRTVKVDSVLSNTVQKWIRATKQVNWSVKQIKCAWQSLSGNTVYLVSY